MGMDQQHQQTYNMCWRLWLEWGCVEWAAGIQGRHFSLVFPDMVCCLGFVFRCCLTVYLVSLGYYFFHFLFALG